MYENYIDRKYSSQVGVYTQTVSEQYYPYIHPQETGNKTDVRFLELLSDKLKLIEASYVFLVIKVLYFLNKDLVMVNRKIKDTLPN